jgi:hypothetical protein
VDRRALVVGSWQGRDRPSPQRVQSITNRWKNIFKEDRYRFRNLKSKKMPTILHNPETADLINHLIGASKITSDTELLFYFVGHRPKTSDRN